MGNDHSFLDAYKQKLADQTNGAPDSRPDGLPVNAAPAGATPANQAAGAPAEPVAREPADVSGPAAREPVARRPLRFEEPPLVVPLTAGTAGAASLHGRRRTWVLPLAIVILLAVLIVAFLVWYTGRGTEVIDLSGWKLTDAQIWATDHTVNLQVTKAFSDTVDADLVISQDLKPGDRIARSGFLKVKVSLGHDQDVTLPLPDLLAMSKSQVESWAAANFMSKVRITTEYHAQIPSGQVIRYEINDASVVDLVKRSTPIYVIVSKGPEPVVIVKVEIPDFKTMQLAQAQAFAQEKGLALKIVQQHDDTAPAGTILSQSVAKTTMVDPGTEITLTVSQGKLVRVPDFSAYSKQRATAAAAESGITLSVVERYASQAAGAFISQNLAPGTEYKTGELLELVYSLGNRIVVTTFVGQTRAAAETWITELNSQGAGLKLSITETQNVAPRGTVIQQSPLNSLIAPGATIRLTVSLGRRVFVPTLVAPSGSVYGQIVTREQAAAACSAVGIIPVFQAERKSGRLPGEVWSQSVAAGKEVYEGTTIVLKYVPADVTMAVPDLIGKTREQVIADGFQTKFDITFQTAAEPVPGFEGKVVSQSVPAGRTVAVGSAITLTIGPA